MGNVKVWFINRKASDKPGWLLQDPINHVIRSSNGQWQLNFTQ